MSINNNFFQDEIFDNENFENSYYFPPVFSSSDDLVSSNDFEPLDNLDSGDVFEQFRSESLIDPGLEPGFDRMDSSNSLVGLGVNPSTSQTQATVADQGYVQSYLRSQIGRYVTVDFLLGTSLITDRAGLLVEVGINYIVLVDASRDRIMCDLYSIKFVKTSTAVEPVPVGPPGAQSPQGTLPSGTMGR